MKTYHERDDLDQRSAMISQKDEQNRIILTVASTYKHSYLF